jgi:predicted nucleic acid-binding protein
MVPGIFWAEFGDVMWEAVRLKRWDMKKATAAVAQMLERQLATIADSELLEDATAIALATQRSVYDCLYIALAIRHDAEMITADERLANAVAVRLPVKWLGGV